MSAREALVDIMRIAPSQRESAVLATLRGRYRGERLYRECCDYLTGRTDHVPTRAAAPGRDPDAYIHVVDTHGRLECAYASDWINRYTTDLAKRPPVDVRAAGPDDEPSTLAVVRGILTPVDTPQWVRNVVREAFMRIEDFEDDWATAIEAERDAFMGRMVAFADAQRDRGAV